MQDIRCKNCFKKLLEADIKEGRLEIRCPRCKTLNKYYETRSLQKASSDN